MELNKNAHAASISPRSAFVTMFYKPTSTFARLELRSRAWIPLPILVMATLTLATRYVPMVDISWLQDQLLASYGMRQLP